MTKLLPTNPTHIYKILPKKDFKNAIKLVIVVSKRFWPSRLNGIICSDCFLPEIWFDSPERVGELILESDPQQVWI
jgi:hypothetical protein